MSLEHIERAREKKAAELVQMIDREVFASGMKPAGTPEEIEAVMDVVMAYTAEDWQRLSSALKRKTKAKPPSDETIALVLRTYQHRAEAALVDEDPFARFG